jgi:hypothetical protein
MMKRLLTVAQFNPQPAKEDNLMRDRTTNVLLFAIALGLWLNVATQWLRPVVLKAADTDISTIEHDVHSIEHDVHTIYSGICLNSRICG